MKMNEITVFNNENFGDVRTIEIDGDPWFVGKDVAEILGYSNTRDALLRHVDEEDKNTVVISDGIGNPNQTIINESGLYSLVLSSKLESAKKFKRWITSEVIPQIRKTGAYHTPKTYAEALRALADEAEKAEALKKQNQLMQPKADFFDAVTDSKTAIPIGDVAKILDIGIGRNKLFEFLRQKNILTADNRPYQKYIDSGYFRVIEQKYEVNGEVRINIKTLVFQKGIDWIRKQLVKENAVDEG